MPLAVVLLVVLGTYFGLKYARSRGIGWDSASRWVFALLVVVALVLVLAKLGRPVAAGMLGLAAALGWRFLPKWLIGAAQRPSARPQQEMSRSEALSVLGLPGSATESEIATEYRRLIKQLHPDRGGSEYLAAKVNEAKRVLLGR